MAVAEGLRQFDYLKSLEIGEKINKIRWCPGVNGAHLLLSTNGASPHRKSCVCVRSCHRGSCPGRNCLFGGAVEHWRAKEEQRTKNKTLPATQAK